MKRKLAIIMVAMMLIMSLAACGSTAPENNTTNKTESNQQNGSNSSEKENAKTEQTGQESSKEQAEADNSKEQADQTGNEQQSAENTRTYNTRINISINPDADVLTDENGKVIDIVCNNEDAVTAYSGLDVAGKELDEVTREMVNAATNAGFMTDEKPVTLTIVDSASTGQELLDEAQEAKKGVQDALTDENFENAPIVADVAQQEVKDDTCDLCYGTGVLVCEDCHGTTYLDGNAWTSCGKCSANGKYNCTLCGGAGNNACDSCGGTGTDANQEDGKCFSCHGAGSMSCVRCGGAGYQECDDCHGAGRLGGLPCPHCGGTLWGMCNRCNGSGKNAH